MRKVTLQAHMELNLLMYLEYLKGKSLRACDMIIFSFLFTILNQSHNKNPLLYDPVFKSLMEEISMRERN